MVDHFELKKLAEAAPEGPWFGPEYAPGTSYVFDVDLGALLHYESIESEQDACLRYVAAANPVAVLVLIAENDRLKTLRSKTERELAQELEVWQHGPSCWNCGDTGDVHGIVGEWRGKCDCFAAQLIDATQERDQLRAEIAGLKTGYEAYEQVNAGLKAECEVLRKDADKWQSVQRAMTQLQSDEQGAAIWSACSRILISVASGLNSSRSVVTEEGVTNGGVEIGDWRVTVERIDAAMSKGEQS